MIAHQGPGGGEAPEGTTYSVLPLFFKSVLKLSDLLFKALNPSGKLGGSQVLLFFIVGPQRGASPPVRGTTWVSCPPNSHRLLGGAVGCAWTEESQEPPST
jgi:hypothetical protein